MRLLVAFLLFGASAWAEVPCACLPGSADRQCSLCGEAEKQDPSVAVFFLKDTSPRKPNRWLALPRVHGEGNHALEDLPARERTALWTAAIAKAKELWGDDWGVAYNGPKVRTQCHLHIHIGKLLKGVEEGKPLTVSTVAQIPKPNGDGLWVHPVGRRLHVHTGEQTCETVLLR